jgi:hypothetical protein
MVRDRRQGQRQSKPSVGLDKLDAIAAALGVMWSPLLEEMPAREAPGG